jgi:hypothetical protein
VKDAEPFLFLITIHHQQSNLILVVLSHGRYDLSFPGNGAKMLSPTPSQAKEDIERGNFKPLTVP